MDNTKDAQNEKVILGKPPLGQDKKTSRDLEVINTGKREKLFYLLRMYGMEAGKKAWITFPGKQHNHLGRICFLIIKIAMCGQPIIS
jgi:hypothetical protein